jgi:hypothetical protein
VRARGSLTLSVAAAACWSAAGGGARAAGAPDPDLGAALDAAQGADVVLFELPAAAGAPRVRAATVARASPAAVSAVLLDPAHYRALIPALVRSEATPSATPGERIVAWELEVPLFNLKGRMALRARPDGVEMRLIDGDLAPGRVIFTAAPRPDGRALVTIDAQADVRRSNFFVRRTIARSPVGEPAALAAAAWVALRATALRAEHVGQPQAWRPTAPLGTPAPDAGAPPDPRLLAEPSFAPLRARGVPALVGRAPSERLTGVAVAVTLARAPATSATWLRDPRSWLAFPGWRTVRLLPAARAAQVPPIEPPPPSAEVEDSIPFVDLDATWSGQPSRPPSARWTATAGATTGARLGWDVYPAPIAGASPASTIAVLSLYPRLERTGFVARRTIAAEPLFEHGLALALAFVDAVGVKFTMGAR